MVGAGHAGAVRRPSLTVRVMSTALVTGATAGIGAAFATALAAERRPLVMVARDEQRLSRLAKTLRDRYAIEVETIAADLADDAGCRSAEQRLADPSRPIEMLINNAGFGGSASFWERPVEHGERMLMLNVRAVLRLTHAAIGGMRARGRGDIINVSSVAGFVPAGRDVNYGASKAWVIAFSQALDAELANSGVRVSAVCPGYTHTEFHERAGIDMSRLPEWLWLDAASVVRTALRDHRRGRVVSVPGLPYKVAVTASRFAPPSAIRLAGRLSRQRLS